MVALPVAHGSSWIVTWCMISGACLLWSASFRYGVAAASLSRERRLSYDPLLKTGQEAEVDGVALLHVWTCFRLVAPGG